MMDVVQWILVYMGQTLLALFVVALWIALAFLIYDEIRSALRPEPANADDNNQDGGLE